MSLITVTTWQVYYMMYYIMSVLTEAVPTGSLVIPSSASTPSVDSPATSTVTLEDIMFQDAQPLSIKRSSSEQCQHPCKCTRSNEALACKTGVNIIKDGCDCCHMCARQQGEICDYRDKCDEVKGLYCDFSLDDGIRGYCRASAAKSCDVSGETWKDGQLFQLNCSMQCTCQNGLYACASLCPQEERPPSKTHCKDAQLVAIKGRCCREWVCPYSHSLPRPEDNENNAPDTTVLKDSCPVETTGWSACSATCGMGWSIRVTNRNKDCISTQEKQLCLVRPCELNDKHLHGDACKKTWRQDTPIRLHHDGCTSVTSYRPKYCSLCKRQSCCQPNLTKQLNIELKCEGGKTIFENSMWIKNCKCSESSC